MQITYGERVQGTFVTIKDGHLMTKGISAVFPLQMLLDIDLQFNMYWSGWINSPVIVWTGPPNDKVTQNQWNQYFTQYLCDVSEYLQMRFRGNQYYLDTITLNSASNPVDGAFSSIQSVFIDDPFHGCISFTWDVGASVDLVCNYVLF